MLHVLPAYKKQFWDDCERKGVANAEWDNFKRHKEVAQTWCRGLRDNWRWDFYGEVRDPLLNWAEVYSLRDYSLRVEWMLQRALDAFLFWSRHFTHFEKFERFLSQAEIESAAQRLKPKYRSEFLAEQRDRECRIKQATIAWPVRVLTPENTTVETVRQSFQYLPWDGYDIDHYCAVTTKLFSAHLEQYRRSEIESMASIMEPVPVLSKPERFEALALKVCRGLSAAKIGKEVQGYSKHETVISKDIAAAAKLIHLPTTRRRAKEIRKSLGRAAS